jgi:5'-3' exonuclease
MGVPRALRGVRPVKFNPNQERMLVIDGDMLLFRKAAKTEVEVELSDWIWTRHSDCLLAMELYWNQVYQWCEDLNVKPQNVAHCFSARSAWRRRIYPSYKHNRKDKPKPIGFGAMRREILDQPNGFCFDEIEADDVMGLFCTMPGSQTDVIVASGDKDLKQVPGWHIWEDVEPYFIGNEDAERFTYQQYLQGDSTDGIPGCKGVGEVRAKEIVKDFDLKDPLGCWETIVRVYETKGKVDNPHDYALTQARLTRILRYGEYDFNNHTVKPWTPPTQTH